MRAGRGVWREEAADGKTVWSWHPLLVSSRRRFAKPNRATRAANSPATEARGIRLRGERGISRKTIAQGKPGVPAHLRSAVCIFAHDCGCHGHPAFPAPSISRGHRRSHNFGRYPRREIAMSYPVPATSFENNYGRRDEHRHTHARPIRICTAPLFAGRAD
jgi:hypothetical protein